MATLEPSPHNGVPTLTTRERDRRWGWTRDFMDEHGLDFLIAFPGGRAGFNSYLANDEYRETVIFPRDGQMTALCFSAQVVVLNLIRRERGWGTWVEDLRVGMAARDIIDVLKEKGCDRSAVGVLGLEGVDSFNPEGFVPYTAWVQILDAFPHATFKDVTRPYLYRMLVKGDEELAQVHYAAAGGEQACRRLLEVTKPGVSESDLYQAAMEVLLRWSIRSEWMILQSGPDNPAWGRPLWTFGIGYPRTLQDQDIVLAELFPHCGYLEVQQQMCISIGKLSPTQQECARVARESYIRGIDAIKPGVAFSEVVAAMEVPYTKEEHKGLWRLTPLIHTLNPLATFGNIAVGLERGPSGLEAYKIPEEGEGVGWDFVLQPGMVLELEPNAHIDRSRINIGGTVEVTKNGAVELNQIPTDVAVI